MRKMYVKALLLLILFVSATGVSSLHTHGESHLHLTCEDCLHHQPHAGHLCDDEGDFDDCILCRFLALPLVVAAGLIYTRPAENARLMVIPILSRLCGKAFSHIRLRGPPVPSL